jgi:hypothetical protein
VITWQAQERKEMRTGFWCGNLEERSPLEEVDVDGKILNWALKLE